MSFHRPIYSSDQIRQLEKQHADIALMERAGLAIFNYVQLLLPDSSSSILLLAGPGNNGGDALVAARLLRDIYSVTVVQCGDINKLPPDAKQAYVAWLASGGKVLDAVPDNQFDLVVDGLLGIGINKALEGPIAELVGQINRLNTHVLAIDIPSGLCAKTGRVLGDAVRADWTMTFLGLKSGLFTLDGPDHAGEVILETLDIKPDAKPTGYLLEQEDVATFLPKRRRNSNKGSYGNVGVLGGAAQMTGAAVIAARAALLSGAGRVYAGLLAPHAPKFDVMVPELMVRAGEDIFDQGSFDCLVVGPGMGQSDHAKRLLERSLLTNTTLLLDADALNLLAEDEALQVLCHDRHAANIVTPHPGEAARMMSSTVQEVQTDRIASALEIAKKYNAVTVLKGCGTIIAMPSGDWYINHSGNPGLASAGMGDALAGIIAALVAQKISPEQAALLGVYIHGAAADALVEHGIGPIGLTASEVMMEVRRMLNQGAEWGQA
ncbi:MAG: NAD(P)H-hydrate dehydratase [Methylophilaceae bacterium]|nr:NAD(P)H-hydrate dehydratase [Methylophilaceae bacterium]